MNKLMKVFDITTKLEVRPRVIVFVLRKLFFDPFLKVQITTLVVAYGKEFLYLVSMTRRRQLFELLRVFIVIVSLKMRIFPHFL